MIPKKKILVIGDLMLDRYWMGEVNRISPEAPVPILDVSKCIDKPGGAANVALNLSDLGMDITLTGLTGDDEASAKLNELLSALDVNYIPIVDSNIRTTMKLRVIDKNKQLMRIDHEDINASKSMIQSYKKILQSQNFDGIIVSDYDKGVVKPIVKDLLSKTNKMNIKVFIDPKGDDFSIYKDCYLLKPNLKEFENIMGRSATTGEFKEKGEALRTQLSLTYLLITLGKDGMMLFEDGNITSYNANQLDVYDVTGAGDTVISTLSAYVIAGELMSKAVEMSNIAAGLSVQKLGSTSVSQSDLENANKE